MLAVVGTVPDLSFPLTHGPVRLLDGHLYIADKKVPINRGTPALLAAAVKTSEYLELEDIYAFLIGDTGLGDGSRRLYGYLEQHLMDFDPIHVLTFHYLQPDVDWHNRILFTIEALYHRPVLIADAGFMYAAKMSGQAPTYDFFTPDAGELAFLADEKAPHPFYTRGFILHRDDGVPDLIERSYQYGNAAKFLLVKGKTDYIVNQNQILETVEAPSFDAMEAIGGTGDTLTGILTVLCGYGFGPAKAAITAAKVNRLMGQYARPNPATQVVDLIDKIPRAIQKQLC